MSMTQAPDSTSEKTLITGLRPADRPRWTELWGDYLAFYQTTLPPAVFEATWSRLLDGVELHGLAARDPTGHIIGITHYLFHATCWTTARACYLQDLYVDPAHRGAGAGRLLIEAVSRYAQKGGADRLYWLTQETNTAARRLYDTLAKTRGFIRYEYPFPA